MKLLPVCLTVLLNAICAHSRDEVNVFWAYELQMRHCGWGSTKREKKLWFLTVSLTHSLIAHYLSCLWESFVLYMVLKWLYIPVFRDRWETPQVFYCQCVLTARPVYSDLDKLLFWHTVLHVIPLELCVQLVLRQQNSNELFSWRHRNYLVIIKMFFLLGSP